MNAKTMMVMTLALVGVGSGCAQQMYRMQHVAIPADKALLLAAVEELVAQQGFEHVHTSRDAGLVEAVHVIEQPVVDMRERWFFFVSDNQVSVERRFEVRFEKGERWQSADEVCDTYRYEPETAQLALLQEVLSRPKLASR